MFEQTFSAFFATHLGRRLGLGLLVVLSCLLCWTVITGVRTLVADVDAVRIVPLAILSDNKNTLDTDVVANIPSYHLFGVAMSGADLPITNLQFQLTGIMKDLGGYVSKVIISAAGESGKVYRIGEQLTQGIKIYGINEDGVVLQHGARLEKLPMSRAQLAFVQTPTSLWKNEED